MVLLGLAGCSSAWTQVNPSGCLGFSTQVGLLGTHLVSAWSNVGGPGSSARGFESTVSNAVDAFRSVGKPEQPPAPSG
eukprot:14145661-Alexandrium_andersonii.AAC.1